MAGIPVGLWSDFVTRCAEFYDKWEEMPNFCGKDSATVSQINSFLKVLKELETAGIERSFAIANFPENNARPLFAVRDLEIRQEIISCIVDWLKKNKKPMQGDVKTWVEMYSKKRGKCTEPGPCKVDKPKEKEPCNLYLKSDCDPAACEKSGKFLYVICRKPKFNICPEWKDEKCHATTDRVYACSPENHRRMGCTLEPFTAEEEQIEGPEKDQPSAVSPGSFIPASQLSNTEEGPVIETPVPCKYHLKVSNSCVAPENFFRMCTPENKKRHDCSCMYDAPKEPQVVIKTLPNPIGSPHIPDHNVEVSITSGMWRAIHNAIVSGKITADEKRGLDAWQVGILRALEAGCEVLT